MADATASKKSSDHIKIEDVGPARKRLTITIPVEVIKQKITESMQTLSSETTLPGFRKGHVPSQLLERRFGTALRNETKNQIIADAYASAIEELELKPIGEPEPADSLDELELVDDKPLEFSIEVEVVPDIERPSLEDLEIMRPNLDIEELHIDRELKRLRSELGETSEIKDNIQPEDRLFGHAIVTKKGDEEPVLDQNKVLIIYPTDEEDGRGPVLGLMIDKLADSLKGKSVGDTITLKTTGPDSHEREDLRGAGRRGGRVCHCGRTGRCRLGAGSRRRPTHRFGQPAALPGRSGTCGYSQPFLFRDVSTQRTDPAALLRQQHS